MSARQAPEGEREDRAGARAGRGRLLASLPTPATEEAEPEQPQGLGGAWLFRSWKSAAGGGAGTGAPGRPCPETRDRRPGWKGAPGVRERNMKRASPPPPAPLLQGRAGLCGILASGLPGRGVPSRFLT